MGWGTGNIGGGGASLNFKVVGGTTAPSNPKENTIWVNTDIPISWWEFNMFSVSNPFEGLVWFAIGNTGNIEFNALKKNGILIRPLATKQYIAGAWVDVECKIYQNGTWVDWYNRDERIALLNATGWARYSEGVAGEYVRSGGRGFTRNSILPAIWCWSIANGNYYGWCLLAASRGALSANSVTDYGGMNIVEATTPKGNTVYAGCMYNMMNKDIEITSNGSTHTLLYANMGVHYVHRENKTIDSELGSWADELLFG